VTHANTTHRREVGGLLVGEVSHDNGAYITVTGAVAAEHTIELRSSLTFTHESWRQMLAVIERDYPEQVIVGWYHTHPGYGIFLSRYDLFIQRNFFNQPYQIALVIDPVASTIGAFHWSGETIFRGKGLPLYGTPSSVACELTTPTMPLTLDVEISLEPSREPEEIHAIMQEFSDKLGEDFRTLAEDMRGGLSRIGQVVGGQFAPMASQFDRMLAQQQLRLQQAMKGRMIDTTDDQSPPPRDRSGG